jgi:hypothetical protein
MIKQLIIMFLLTCACITIQAQVQNIITIAGIDSAGYSGDGGPAINAKLHLPESINLDKRGNLYIADLENGRIRKIILSTGIITTIAGNGAPTDSGDNGLAINAAIGGPTDVFSDMEGNVFFTDPYFNKVRKINVSTGIITAVAGNGILGNSGDGGLATNAELNGASGLCVDNLGNIYIAGYYNNNVQKVDAITGIITTIAGTGTAGYAGDGGLATAADFNWPDKIFVDSDGNIYISDYLNNRIRKVNAVTKIVTTIAGIGTPGYSGNGGLAINAEINSPAGIFVDKRGNVFCADYGNGAIRRIDAITGIITTVAGTGIPGFSGDEGSAIDAQLIPGGVQLDSIGIMYIADYENSRIRMVYDPLAVKSLNANNEISIYPNPAQNSLTIENAKGNELTIFNILGEPVFKKIIASNSETINISNLPNDIYMVQIVDTEKMIRITKKVVKIN